MAKQNEVITFKELVQTLRDYGDSYASVMPYAKDAEAPVWGVNDIWFVDGVLMIGQHDDEGLPADMVAECIQACVPEEMLDTPAVVKIGATYRRDGVNFDVCTPYGEPAKARLVKSSEVKRKNSDFCKWILKFAS